jgi:hypothetical protein
MFFYFVKIQVYSIYVYSGAICGQQLDELWDAYDAVYSGAMWAELLKLRCGTHV